MPSTFVDVPLGMELHFPGYRPLRIDLAALPCPALVRDLARSLFDRTNTGGTIKSPHTASVYRNAIRHAARWLHAHGFDGAAAELTEALVFDYWRHCGVVYEANTRTLLGALEAATPGLLAPGVAAQLRGVPLNRHTPWQPRQPLTAAETQRLVEVCRGLVDAAEARLAGGQTLVDVGPDTGSDWRAEANLAWLVDHHGPHHSKAIARREGVVEWRASKALTPVLAGVHEALFPTNDDALAFRLLVGLQTGICPEGVDGLRAESVEWISATDARISWFKARGSGRQNHVFASRGPWSPGRLIERWLALSARGRRFAPDPSALWLMCDAAHLRIRKPVFGWDFRDSFVARHGLHFDDGTPLRLRFSALRATYFARHDRQWNGALRIDPNHSSRVEGDHYLAQTRASEPLEATIEAAQRDAVRKASLAPLTVLGPDELAALDDDRPRPRLVCTPPPTSPSRCWAGAATCSPPRAPTSTTRPTDGRARRVQRRCGRACCARWPCSRPRRFPTCCDSGPISTASGRCSAPTSGWPSTDRHSCASTATSSLPSPPRSSPPPGWPSTTTPTAPCLSTFARRRTPHGFFDLTGGTVVVYLRRRP
ncbi:MAG: hypothetical protein ACR2LJ_10760 [Acidimicrobiales bacterium]